MQRLRGLEGPAEGVELVVDSDLVVGRGTSAGLDDPGISRRHAKISRDAGGALAIEDLGSRNGTKVNGDAISTVHRLHSGDRVEIGASIFVVDESEPPLAHFPEHRSAQRSYWVPLTVGAVLVVLLGLAIFLAMRPHGPAVACDNHDDPEEPVALTAYLESNAPGDGNAIFVQRYAAEDLQPLPIDCFPTDGGGSSDLADTGVLDSDQQVVLDTAQHRLYAVNQGSDSIAVFDVETGGDLRAIDGSPFDSGGFAPVSLGLDGSYLVVANKGYDGVRELDGSQPNLTTLAIGADGALTPVPGSTIDLPAFSGPGQALIPPVGGMAFVTGPGAPLRSYVVGPDGRLVEAPDSPQAIASAAYPPGFPDEKRFSVGLAVHPTEPLMYANLPPASGLAVYSFDASARLSFVSAVDNVGSWLPCWATLSRDGRVLYTANAGSNNVTVFDLTDPAEPRQIQSLPLEGPGNPWNLSLDPSGRHLVVLTPRDFLGVPEGEGNTMHLLDVAADGTLRERSSSLVKLPVAIGTNPIGLAVT